MLTVASIAYPFAPVGADAVGGAEQVLSTLDRALVAAGHRSIVVACEGSATAGRLLAVPRASGELTEAARAAVHEATRAIVAEAARQADIVHMHGIDFHAYLPPPGHPTLVTLHLPPDWYPAETLTTPGADVRFACVSASQSRACPPDMLLTAVIPNGVPVDALQARHAPRGHLLMLGRVCPEKGQHLALQAAHAAGNGLLIGGEVFPYAEHRAYFEACVAPLLDERRRYLGPLGFARKRRLLTAARCLLVPSLAAETSSLVSMEAMACGTPVVAFRSGALPEIIEDGVTGFLVDGVAEMTTRIAQVDRLDRTAIRAAARRRFSAEAMTNRYLALYHDLHGALDHQAMAAS